MALSMMAYVIIDAGGTFLKSAVLDSQGKIFQGSAFSISSFSEGSKGEILQAFREIISKGLRVVDDKKMDLGGIGVAFPGPFDIEKATPLMNHKFQSIFGLDLRESFYETSGILRNVPILFIHDANAVLVGELWKGNAKGFNNVAVVTLGTGLGFAISEKGKVLCNEIGGPFLSIFKLPYKDGILEDYTAKRGFVKIYSELSQKSVSPDFSVADIGKLADKGDPAAVATFEKVGLILAKELSQILKKHEIECLLFSGQISKSFKYMEPTIRKELKNISCLKIISIVENIDQAALLGTLKKCLDN